MTTPDPVPLPLADETEMFTTDCSTRAAMPATESGARLSVADVELPVPKLADGSVSEPSSARLPATYPADPPATSATASEAPTMASRLPRRGDSLRTGPPMLSVG